MNLRATSRMFRVSAAFALVILGVNSAQEASGQADSTRSAPLETRPYGFPDANLSDLLVRQWTIDDGLTTETLTGVVQTKDGYLWISTYEGLMRSNGLVFDAYGKPALNRLLPEGAELVADGFFDLHAVDDGSLWVAAQEGQVLRFREGEFEIVQTSIQGPVYNLCTDSQKRVWAGGSTSAVIDPRHDPPKASKIPGMEDVAVEATACAAETVWLGSSSGFVYRLENGEKIEEVEVGHAVDSLAIRTDGSLWIGHRDGLSLLRDEGMIRFEQLRGVGVYRLVEDRGGVLWIATTRGLGRLIGESVEWLDPVESGLDEAHALKFDRENNLWIAGRRGGLFRLKAPKIGRVTSAHGLPAGAIDALHQMRDGRILVGHDDHLVVVDAERRVTEVPLPVAPFDIMTMTEDRRGVVWLGSYLGMIRLFPQELGGGFRYDTKEGGFPSSQIRAFHQDRQGTMWIGTGNRGILILSEAAADEEKLGEETPEILDTDAGLLSNFVFALRENSAGELLISLRGGFQIRSPAGELTTYRSGVDLPGSIVFNLAEDVEGRIWAATDAGLVRIEDGTTEVLDVAAGLPSEVLFDVAADVGGNLWMSSSIGLIRLAEAEIEEFFLRRRVDPEAQIKFELLTEEDGLPNRQCTGARHVLKTRSGELWFPTHGGVAVVETREIASNRLPPPVVIDRMTVGGVQVDPREEISLDPGLNRYIFEFDVLSLKDPEANQVQYRLEGFDAEWQDAGEERSVAYTSLPRGSYSFQVVGAGDDGMWNRFGAVIDFEVLPFYYETWWFRLSTALLLGVLIAAFYRWRHREALRRHRQVAELSEQRRRLIVELQQRTAEIDRYLYIFSHDFKNPLLTIKTYTQMILQDFRKRDADRTEKDLGRVAEAADQLNRQLNDLLKVAEIDRAKTSLEVFPFSRVVDVALRRSREKIEQGGVEIVRTYEENGGGSLLLFGDLRRIVEVFEEILENALKFLAGASRPRIEIGAERQETEILCWVRDNGPGIDPAHHQKIFQPLTQLDPKAEGTGIGLTLVARVIERHGGKVWIESGGSQFGTTVRFLLPMFRTESGVT